METAEKLKKLLIRLRAGSPGIDKQFLVKCHDAALFTQCGIADNAEFVALLNYMQTNGWCTWPMLRKSYYGDNYSIAVTTKGFMEAERLMKDDHAKNTVTNVTNANNVINAGDHAVINNTIITFNRDIFIRIRGAVAISGSDNDEAILKSLDGIEAAADANDHKTLYSKIQEFVGLTANIAVIAKYIPDLYNLFVNPHS